MKGNESQIKKYLYFTDTFDQNLLTINSCPENSTTRVTLWLCSATSYSFIKDVHKLRLQEEGGRWSKISTFCKLLYHRKCKRRGVGGQKKTNLVNVVCERPLSQNLIIGSLLI